MAGPTPSDPASEDAPRFDPRLFALDLAFTLGLGLVVIGGRMLVDAREALPWTLVGLGAFVIAGSFFGREEPRGIARILAALTALAGVVALVLALVG